MTNQVPESAIIESLLRRQNYKFGDLGTGGPGTDNGMSLGGPASQVYIPARRVYENADYTEYNFTDQLYLPFNPRRIYLIIQNQSSGNLYINFSGQVAPFTTGLLVASSGGCYEPRVAPKTSINVSLTGIGYAIEGVLDGPPLV